MSIRNVADVARLAALTAVALIVVPQATSTQSHAQLPSGFSKSTRSTAASRPLPPLQQNRGQTNRNWRSSNSYPNRYPNRYPNVGGYANRNSAFNHHSFHPSRFGGGIPRSSTTIFAPSVFAPVIPWGNNVHTYGFGHPVYSNGLGFGGGFYHNYTPAYATYGTFLNSGVLSSNAIGSSVAAQALAQNQLQNPVAPLNQTANNFRDLEILRLQIELERARQQLANQDPAVEQQAMKPPVDANQQAIDELGLAAMIETNQLAAASQLKGERAFRSGDYGQAARFAGLSASLDETNGKLHLFKAQAHFANAEFSESAAAIAAAADRMPADELGWVVENFKLFYGQNDYVNQMRNLSAHLKQSPNDAQAWLLRGYQYGALGYPDAAAKDLEKAKNLGADGQLIETLTNRFAVPVESAGNANEPGEN